jgi:hypothetical protein
MNKIITVDDCTSEFTPVHSIPIQYISIADHKRVQDALTNQLTVKDAEIARLQEKIEYLEAVINNISIDIDPETLKLTITDKDERKEYALTTGRSPIEEIKRLRDYVKRLEDAFVNFKTYILYYSSFEISCDEANQKAQEALARLKEDTNV